MELFSIRCETCQTRLKVRSMAAIGQILSCPKCGGMVQASPPPGWVPPQAEQPPAETPVAAQSAPAEPSSTAVPSDGQQAWTTPFAMQQANPPVWQDWGWPMWTAALGVPLLLLGGIGCLWYSVRQTPPTVVAQKTPVEATPKTPAPSQPEKKTPSDPPEKKTPPPSEPPQPLLPPVAPVTPADPTPPPPPHIKPEVPEPETPAVKPPALVTETTPKVPTLPVDIPPAVPVPEKPPMLVPMPNVAANGPAQPLVLMSAQQVETLLAAPIAEIDLPAVPLSVAMDFVSQLSTLKITLDLEALSAAGVTVDEQVSVKLSEVTLADLLERLLEPRGLMYVVQAGQLRITSLSHQKDVRRAEEYPLAELARDAAAAEALLQLVKTFSESGGTFTLAEGQLKVEHHEMAHRRVNELLKKLKAARSAASQSADQSQAALATRFGKVRELLLKPLTVNYVEQPLDALLLQLDKRCGVNLFVDAIALSSAGLSPRMMATVRNKEAEPLAAILVALLETLELTYRVVDAKTVQITTPQAAAARRELEFHPLAGIADTPTAVANLMTALRKEIASETWDAANSGVAMQYDPASKCLIVLHTQTVQVQVEETLRQLRQETVARAEKPAGS